MFRYEIGPLACIRLGVDYLGTEIDPQYISVSNENIERRKNNPIMNEWLNNRNNKILSE